MTEKSSGSNYEHNFSVNWEPEQTNERRKRVRKLTESFFTWGRFQRSSVLTLQAGCLFLLWELVDSDVNFCSVLWFEPGGSMWVDSDNDLRSGCRNVGHHYRQQSFSGLRSLGRSDYTITLLGLVFVIPLVLVCRRFNENWFTIKSCKTPHKFI